MKKLLTAAVLAAAAPLALTAAAPAAMAEEAAAELKIPPPPPGKGQVLFYRTGGAPSLALGMASIFSRIAGNEAVLRHRRGVATPVLHLEADTDLHGCHRLESELRACASTLTSAFRRPPARPRSHGRGTGCRPCTCRRSRFRHSP